MQVLANSPAQHVATPAVIQSSSSIQSSGNSSHSHHRVGFFFFQMESYSYSSRGDRPLFYSQEWETGDNFSQSFWWTTHVLSANSCKKRNYSSG